MQKDKLVWVNPKNLSIQIKPNQPILWVADNNSNQPKCLKSVNFQNWIVRISLFPYFREFNLKITCKWSQITTNKLRDQNQKPKWQFSQTMEWVNGCPINCLQLEQIKIRWIHRNLTQLRPISKDSNKEKTRYYRQQEEIIAT